MLVDDNYSENSDTEQELINEIMDLKLDPYPVFVCHINSPNEFWIHGTEAARQLCCMNNRFVYAHLYSKVREIKENALCVAKFSEDDSWYRARIISHSDGVLQVVHIDYGLTATATEIRTLPTDLEEDPPLARKCRLVMPQGITKWSDKATEEFMKLADEGAVLFMLDVIEEGETLLVKLTTEGEDVTDILAKFCES